jgi:hypothetical protein
LVAGACLFNIWDFECPTNESSVIDLDTSTLFSKVKSPLFEVLLGCTAWLHVDWRPSAMPGPERPPPEPSDMNGHLSHARSASYTTATTSSSRCGGYVDITMHVQVCCCIYVQIATVFHRNHTCCTASLSRVISHVASRAAHGLVSSGEPCEPAIRLLAVVICCR